MQMVRIPREILRNLSDAIRTQSESDEDFAQSLECLRRLPENTIGYEVSRFIDVRRALSIPFAKAS
ncbi:MAG: hypothetical protein HC772_11490 [Leptolyngbyaceae cyanobacterium CRU_2_3]|nr:hypothetical protein [Leptolyngbyaceae cyanobacterium CRU_2_3]